MPTTAPPPEDTRKAFLRTMGGGSAALALSGLLEACGGGSAAAVPTVTDKGSTGTDTTPAGTKTSTDIDIVNYALTLEYTEARYYREAVASGEVKGKRASEYFKRFGAVEQEHVDALRATVKQLGGRPVSAPHTDFGLVFEGGEDMIIQIAATIENLGASAYLGQAPRIQDKDLLRSALAIHTVEARHAAALNQLAGRTFKGGTPTIEGTIPDGAFAKPMTMEQVLLQAKPFLRN